MELQVREMLNLSLFDGVLVAAIFAVGFWVFLTIGLSGIASGHPRPWSPLALATPLWGGAILMLALIPGIRTFMLVALLVCLVIIEIGGVIALRREERSSD